MRFGVRLASNFVSHQLRAVALQPQWNVGIVDAPISRFLEATFQPVVRWLPRPPPSHFVADPFGLPGRPDQAFLVETYDYHSRRGVISAVGGVGGRVIGRDLLDVGTHASYPHLVEVGEEVFCVPQLSGRPGIRAFRALEYPTSWESGPLLVPDVVALDATPFQHEGRWWIAFTDGTRGANTHLHLWHAADFHGPWQPHAANPVKIDVRSSRPGGTVFVHEGSLYRPAQDCSRSYGGGVSICRVTELTPSEFREEVVQVFASTPGRYRHGTHTLSGVGERTLIDGKALSFSFPGTIGALRSRLIRGNAPSGAAAPEARAKEA